MCGLLAAYPRRQPERRVLWCVVQAHVAPSPALNAARARRTKKTGH